MVEQAPCVESFPDQGVQAACSVDEFPTTVQVDKKNFHFRGSIAIKNR
jgi:hypothetical protein